MTQNPSAGIADPYWYEWSVGLHYALDMLDPNSNVKHVQLQANDSNKLDDVVVVSQDGSATRIQVKHTRVNDVFNFSDLVGVDKKGNSLLSGIFSEWKILKADHNPCKVIIYSNKSGDTKVTAIFDTLREQLPRIDALSDISLTQYATDFAGLCQQLSPDNPADSLEFLKNFALNLGQDNLDNLICGIHNKLARYFKVDERIIAGLDIQLCGALRQWTTTLSPNRTITRDDLFEALALSQDKFVGEHNLPICEPFFASRESYINDLELKLTSREKPVVFLSGEPGSGKTNIISRIANKPNSVVSLRFHAFKPMMPGDQFISADEGVNEPRDFWSDLLIQLRDKCKGSIAKYNIPVCNGIIPNVDKLREEVLRIAEEYALNSGKTFVIAVDGIDHALRAGKSKTFLSTLPAPSAIPHNVCFLIAGQSLKNYTGYPLWLSGDDVLRFDVPVVVESDLVQLLAATNVNFSNCTINQIAQVIISSTAGNTLSSVFLAQECTALTTLEALQERINATSISSGLSAYYNYIWESSKKQIPSNYFYTDNSLAVTLSMLSQPISASKLENIFSTYNIPVQCWERILSTLFPIVIKTGNSYQVFHNDVRIFLENYMRTNIDEYKITCSTLADFVFSEQNEAVERHVTGFKFLKSAERLVEMVGLFTSDFVMEAIALERPMHEIIDQLDDCLSIIRNNDVDFCTLVAFSCALETINQYQQSLQWTDTPHLEKRDLPEILSCEYGDTCDFNLYKIDSVLSQIDWLIDEGKFDRANIALNNWLGDYTPYTLIEKLNNGEEKDIRNYINGHKEILKKWGGIKYKLGSPVYSEDCKDDSHKLAIAYFNSGLVRKAMNESLQRAFELMRGGLFFNKDHEEMLLQLLTANCQDLIEKYVENDGLNSFSIECQLRFIFWCILHDHGEWCADILIRVLEQGFDLIPKSDVGNKENSFECFAIALFVISLYDNGEKITPQNFKDYVKTAVIKSLGYEKEQETYEFWRANNLLLAYRFLADIINSNFKGISKNTIEMMLDTVFEEKGLWAISTIKAISAVKTLFETFLTLYIKFNDTVKDFVLDYLIKKVEDTNSILLIDIWWIHLYENGRTDILEKVASNWLNPNDGKVWQLELHETIDVANKFIALANVSGVNIDISNLKGLLAYKKVGYVGRKEYSLYNLLSWFKSIPKQNLTWNNPGIKLLNISEYASETGDNRADIAISGAVAAVAGTFGASAVLSLIKTIKPQKRNDLQLVADAIISSFEEGSFTEDEVLLIWETALDIFKIDQTMPRYNATNNIKLIYLCDIRTVAVHFLQRINKSDLMCCMREIAPFEFDYQLSEQERSTYKIPTRWFETDNKYPTKEYTDGVDGKAFDERFRFALNSVENDNSGYVDIILSFFYAERENENFTYENIIQLISAKQGKQDIYSFSWNGTTRLYDCLYPILSSNERESIKREMFEHYDYCQERLSSDHSWIYQINEDFGSWVLWLGKLQVPEQRLYAFQQLLDTHLKWITANGRLVFKGKYCEDVALEAGNWIDVCGELKTIAIEVV